MKLKAPQLLVDVFRDLRDRRLLIPAAALAIALVAVPLLLSRSSEPAPPPLAPEGNVAVEGAATQPAVLVETVTVRDYRRRLDRLKSKNPFSEHFTVPPSNLAVGSLEGTPVDQPGSAAGGATATVPAGSSSSASTASTGTTSTGSGSSSSSPSSTASNPPPAPPPVTRFLTRRIDVLVGPVGNTEPRNNIKQLKLLPSKASPVVAFLGVSEDGKQAVFLVSDDVASTSGDGSCFPSASNCQYLVMGEGDDRTFDYTPDGLTYRLKLKHINDVELKDAPGVSIP